MNEYPLLVSIYIGSIKSKIKYKSKNVNRKIKLTPLYEFNITNWDMINAYDAKWYLLNAVEFENDPNSYVTGDFCDFKIIDEKYSDFIDFNPKYLEEFNEILTNIKANSEIGAVIVLFRLEPGNRVEGVLTIDEFMNKLAEGHLRFNTAYLIR